MPLLPIPTPSRVVRGALNAVESVARGGFADLTPMPGEVIERAPQCAVTRFDADPTVADPPQEAVLLVPPLAAPADCFDLRRGCSLVEHLVGVGHPTYLVDYGAIGFADRALGLEHWIREVIPHAVRTVAADGERPRAVHLIGWSLGGIMTLLTHAADVGLPIASVAMVGSPFDFRRVRFLAPFRPAAALGDGVVGTTIYRALGTAPAPLVRLAFEMTGIDRKVTGPVVTLAHLDDRDWLAHQQAVDGYMSRMAAYPGRSFGQLYHLFFRVNEMAAGTLMLDEEEIRLDAARVPVLSVAGSEDVLAPRAAVHAVGELVPRAPRVSLTLAPGGHLGVLTGRHARVTTWRQLDLHLFEAGRAHVGGAQLHDGVQAQATAS